MYSKRKRKLKDFSDFETDFSTSTNKQIKTEKEKRSVQSLKSNKVKGNNGKASLSNKHYKTTSTKGGEKEEHSEELNNESEINDIEKFEYVIRIEDQGQECSECDTSKPKNNHDEDFSVSDHIDTACIDHNKQTNQDVIMGNDVITQTDLKESKCSSKVKIVSARILTGLDANTRNKRNDISNNESNTSKQNEESNTGDNGTSMDKQSEMHNKFNFGNLKHALFTCTFENCLFSSEIHSEWLQHFRQIHQKKLKKPLQCYCLRCDYSPPEKRLLKEHLLVKHNDTPTSPVGYRFCKVSHIDTELDMKIVACTFCGVVMNHAEVSKGHKCERLPFNFYCPYCDGKEERFEVMANHIQTCHGSEHIYGKEVSTGHKNVRTSQQDPACYIDDYKTSCEECQADFNNNTELKLHVNNAHAVFPFGCGVCRLCYGRLSGVKDHMKRVHKLSHQCSKCLRRFGCRPDLERHEWSHSIVKPFKCDHCDNGYSDKGALQTHIGLKHPTVWNDSSKQPGSYMCDLCGEHLETSKQFQRHHLKNHSDKTEKNRSTFNCKVCSQTFDVKRKYDSHQCDVSSNSLKIGKVALDIDSLNKMLQQPSVKSSPSLNERLRETTGKTPPGFEKKVKCSLCNKEFGGRKSLKQHLFVVHLNMEDKSYVCNICDRRFLKKTDLKNHLRIHSNSKPYHCKICTKTFRQLGHVKEHLLSHSIISKFPCPLCSLAFKTKPSLRRHVSGHCKMFPFECPVQTCSYKFATISLLIAHFRQCTEPSVECYKCKLCNEDLVDMKATVFHMKAHESDNVYVCVPCNESFTSPVRLCWHKIKYNHFTEEEHQHASVNKIQPQNFKYETESDVPPEQLLNMYEYVKQHDLEVVDVETTQTADSGHDIEEEGNEHGEIMYKPEQSNHVQLESAVFDTIIDNELNQQFSSELPPFTETVELTNTDQPDNVTEQNGKSEDYIEASYEGVILPKSSYMGQEEVVRTEHIYSDLLTGGNSTDEPTVVVLNGDDNTDPKVIENGDVSDGSGQIVCENDIITDSSETNTLPNSVVDENVNYSDAISSVEGKNEGTGAIALDDNPQAVIKILDEHGDEVHMYNQEGCPIPIEGNSALLQTILSTGKFSIQLTCPNTETEFNEAIEVNGETMNDVAVNGNILDSTEFTNRQEASVGEAMVHDIVSNPELGNFVCDNDATADNLPISLVKIQSKVKHQDLMNNDAIKNVDKIKGILTDNEAERKNQKNENNSFNYKVRLCYYEDRKAEQYPLKCDVCEKRYKRKKDLNLHRKVHLSNNERPYQCDECGKGFTTRHAYRNHQLTHSGDRPFSCDQCDKTFRQLGHLQTHLRFHADYRPFQCIICQKSYLTNSILKRHVKIYHNEVPGENDLSKNLNKCSLCDKSFRSIEDLQGHRIKHLNKDQESQLLSVFSNITNQGKLDTDSGTNNSKRKRAAATPHICDICGKSVTSLNRHKMLHATGSTVKCNHCEKQFATRSLLQTHRKKSHPDEPYQCETCGIQLYNYNALWAHLKVHTRPSYSCLKCEKVYVSKRQFLGHLLTCVGDSFMQTMDACFTVDAQ